MLLGAIDPELRSDRTWSVLKFVPLIETCNRCGFECLNILLFRNRRVAYKCATASSTTIDSVPHHGEGVFP